MTTLKDARQFDAAQQHQVSTSFFKHLADMNYQIMTVDNYGHKHFMVPIFAKIPSQQPIFNVYYKVMIIMVLRNSLFNC